MASYWMSLNASVFFQRGKNCDLVRKNRQNQMHSSYGHKDPDWLIEPGYDPDRNLLSMFSRTVLVWAVDFVMAVGPVKAIVCFNCVSTACQQWWWGLGWAAFIVAATDNLSIHSLVVVLHSGSLSTPAVTAVIVKLSSDARVCVQMDEQNAGRLKISY